LKKNITKISLKEAKLLALQTQGFFDNNFGEGKKATLKIIEHLGYLQIDALSVVARAHHHTLWTRLPDYNEKYLDEFLEKDKTIFEYWSHAASYLPMKDYRFSLPLKNDYSNGKSHWFNQDNKMNEYILDKIISDGALQSKDFEFKKDSQSGWYDWKPAKKALEQLFMQGKLMVAKRKGFQKVYDLTERVLPKNIDITMPTLEEYAEHLIKKAISSHGFVNENEITYLRNKLKPTVKKVIKRMILDDELEELKVDGLDDIIFFTTKDNLKSIENIRYQNNIHFLSPFDNSIIQRKRVKKIFNFDYIIECYIPEAKRQFGYFSLPILYNNEFVGRFDPKVDRKNKIFYIKTLHFENNFKPNEDFNNLFMAKLNDFSVFNGCEKIIIQNANDKWKQNLLKTNK
jgi:uncharacterized protein YcaQ